jgi:hypothetical protein
MDSDRSRIWSRLAAGKPDTSRGQTMTAWSVAGEVFMWLV